MSTETVTAFDFDLKLKQNTIKLTPLSIETLQLNITRLCNQACLHCHVDSSPKRREMMSTALIDKALAVLAKHPEIKNLDITGGAPELHADFKRLVSSARALGKHVMVRHNLTVTLDPHPLTGESMQDLPAFFKAQQVEVVCSLPYYQAFFTDKQRGKGVFGKSIESLKQLNQLGFGQPDTGLLLNLVYNPVGAFLPAAQEVLEADYKRSLQQDFGLVFNHLFTITNMPIKRFRSSLERLGNYEAYMEKLMAAFNPAATEGLMCRSLLSVGYDGTLYDCDFNQMLELPIALNEHAQPNLRDFDHENWLEREIVTGSHCFGCTAGAGSSCTGTTA